MTNIFFIPAGVIFPILTIHHTPHTRRTSISTTTNTTLAASPYCAANRATFASARVSISLPPLALRSTPSFRLAFTYSTTYLEHISVDVEGCMNKVVKGGICIAHGSKCCKRRDNCQPLERSTASSRHSVARHSTASHCESLVVVR